MKSAAAGVCHSDLHVIDVRPGDHVIGCLTTFRFDIPKYVDFYLDGRLRRGEAARQVIVF